MLCERIADGASAASDAITTWKDGQAVDYCLRPLKTRLPVPPYDDDNAPALPWNRNTAIFEIGRDVLVKVKYTAADERSTEGKTVRLVRKLVPSVPVPEAIHFWHDKKLERIFIITRRVHGKMADDVWHSLKAEDHVQVARELAAYQKSIAEITAPAFQDVEGHRIPDRHFLPYDGEWHEPFTAEELREQLRKASNGIEPPEFGPEFHLFHGDLGPSNVILSGMDEPRTEGESHVHVAGIVDWQYAGFYPKFWITTLPLLPHPQYALSVTMEQMESPRYSHWVGSYIFCLLTAMGELGFQDDFKGQSWWIAHHAAMGKPDPW